MSSYSLMIRSWTTTNLLSREKQSHHCKEYIIIFIHSSIQQYDGGRKNKKKAIIVDYRSLIFSRLMS